mgnify:CR=1 FL=1
MIKEYLNRIFFEKSGVNSGEDEAARFLKKQGYKIVAKNYREKCGEIDIISLDGKVLVFTEVKQRKNDRFGRPEDFVTKTKRERLRKTAQLFIMKKRFTGLSRFDVIEVLGENNPEIRHIKNAF